MYLKALKAKIRAVSMMIYGFSKSHSIYICVWFAQLLYTILNKSDVKPLLVLENNGTYLRIHLTWLGKHFLGSYGEHSGWNTFENPLNLAVLTFF